MAIVHFHSFNIDPERQKLELKQLFFLDPQLNNFILVSVHHRDSQCPTGPFIGIGHVCTGWMPYQMPTCIRRNKGAKTDKSFK